MVSAWPAKVAMGQQGPHLCKFLGEYLPNETNRHVSVFFAGGNEGVASTMKVITQESLS